MDYLTNKEFEGMKNDIEKDTIANEQKMNSFAMELMNGLGDEIKETLKQPQINKVHSGPIYRIKKWWSDRKEKRAVKKYLKSNSKYGTKI